jgi:hypothetical protein
MSVPAASGQRLTVGDPEPSLSIGRVSVDTSRTYVQRIVGDATLLQGSSSVRVDAAVPVFVQAYYGGLSRLSTAVFPVSGTESVESTPSSHSSRETLALSMGNEAGVSSVQIAPDGPVAMPDHYAVASDASLSVAAPGFLSNDIDLDGEALTAVAILDNVDNGTLSAFPSGSFQYTPNAGFTGTDAFEYQMRDESGNMATAVVTIEVVLDYIPVVVDIKPGSDPNAVNCTVENDVIAVAILSTEAFDATTVDHETVTLAGATEVHRNKKDGTARRHEKDVDEDGDIDLIFHFLVVETDLTCESVEATLSGETFDGTAVMGTDAVNMIGGDAAKGEGDPSVPMEFALHGNYPNPFNPSTRFRFDLPEPSGVRLSVFDLVGREVAVAIDREMAAGRHSVAFDASALPSGVYLYVVRAGEFAATGRMVLVR